MDYINSKLLIVAKNENITPRDKNQGSWLGALLPLCIILSSFKHPVEASHNYKLLSSISVSLLLSAILLIISSCRNKSSNILKILASIVSAIHLIATGNVNISVIVCISLVILCYEHLLLFLMRKCPKTFTIGEASVILHGIILYLCGVLFNIIFNADSLTDNVHTATYIIQMGLLTLGVLFLLTYKFKVFRKAIPFYLLLSSLIFIFLVLILTGLIKQNAFVWIFDLFADTQRRVYLTVYWMICVAAATLAIRWQISGAKKATTISRKIFHVLAVLVYIPGLLYECTIMYLASGVVFGLLLFIELLRVLNMPPVGESLQEIFLVYRDEKDLGTFALTHLYLLVGCSLPLWIHPALCDVTDGAAVYLLPLLSGLLAIGVGDTGASTIGNKWGTHTWSASQKTVEGTLACITSQLIVFASMYYFNLLQGVTRLQLYKAIASIIVTSLVEAKTSQVDNLVLPLVLYMLLIL